MGRALIIVLLAVVTGRSSPVGHMVHPADSAVVAAVRAVVQSRGEECDVTVQSCSRSEWCALGDSVVTVEPLNPVRLRGNVSVWVQSRGREGAVRRTPVHLLVRTFGKVVSAARPLERHAEVRTGDVELRRVETTSLSADRLRDTVECSGRRLGRRVAAGAVVYRSMLEEMPVIRSGDRVTLVSRTGGIRLSLSATARQDGVSGAVILVQRDGSHERLRCRVLDPRTVEVCQD